MHALRAHGRATRAPVLKALSIQMKTLRDEITETINSEEISEIDFVRMNQWQWVMNRLAEKFLVKGKQSLERIWLWDSIKEPMSSYQSDNILEDLNLLLERGDQYWFIASDEDGKYWVLKGTGKAIVELLSESRLFEYYIAEKDLKWLMCENHHGVVVLKGTIESKYKMLNKFKNENASCAGTDVASTRRPF